MKRIFSITTPKTSADVCLFITRLTVSAFMLTHGIPKLSKLTSGSEIKFADPFGAGPTASLALAVFAEFFCSILLILGLGTRIASVFLTITMLTAAFHAHAADPFSTKEKALLYVVIYLVLMIFGSGSYSLDRLIDRKK